MLPDGALQVTVGDIAGHDGRAAIAMAQARSILRGIAYCSEGAPDEMMQSLDRAFVGLDIAACSSAIVGRLESTGGDHSTFRWSNAGHPPPALVRADGQVSLLEATPDPLLGLDAASDRSLQSVSLEPGATVVLYTDGLVERRGEHFDVSLRRLRHVLRGTHELELATVVQRLRSLAGPDPEDDVALMVIRTHDPTAGPPGRHTTPRAPRLPQP